MTTLTGRTALVTGGSRGIGKAIAFASGTAGCDVAVLLAGNGNITGQTIGVNGGLSM